MMDEKLQQQIENYLDGKLSEQDHSDFETKLQSDKALSEEVDLYRQMDDLLGEVDVMDFSATLDTIRLENQESTQQKAIIKEMPAATGTGGYRRWLSIAAGIALVAVLSAVIYTNLSSVSSDTLYATHMDFPAALGGGSSLRSVGENPTDLTPVEQINNYWQTANDAYQQEQYGVALQALDQIEKIDPTFELESKGDFYFKKGLVQLKLEQIDAAITSFETVTSGDYVANAKWKRALALLKIDEAKAKVALQEIVDKGHEESALANEILQQL